MKTISGPEENWENQKTWDEESRIENSNKLSKDEIYDIKCDEIYDNGR